MRDKIRARDMKIVYVGNMKNMDEYIKQASNALSDTLDVALLWNEGKSSAPCVGIAMLVEYFGKKYEDAVNTVIKSCNCIDISLENMLILDSRYKK